MAPKVAEMFLKFLILYLENVYRWASFFLICQLSSPLKKSLYLSGRHATVPAVPAQWCQAPGPMVWLREFSRDSVEVKPCLFSLAVQGSPCLWSVLLPLALGPLLLS